MNWSKIAFIIYLHLSVLNYFAQSGTLKVAVVGDTPYKISEWKHFKRNINHLDSNTHFLIHVGDIKRGYMPCYKNRYKRTKKFLERSKIPYLIIPGDNEFNDCYCMKPQRAIKVWRKTFVNYPEELPLKRNDSLPENFYFEKDAILFVGINHVGGKVHDSAEWHSRAIANKNWINEAIRVYPNAQTVIVFAHAAPNKHFGWMKYLEELTSTHNKTFWWIQGDIHSYTLNPNWKGLPITRAITDNGIENNGFRMLRISLTDKKDVVFE
jgi:hypothetical protein